MRIISEEENLFANEFEKRYNSLSEDVREKLEKLYKSDYQLNLIKRKRKEINEGDVFVLSPKEGLYFYGKVLEAKTNYIHKDSFMYGQYVIFIFKCKTNSISMENFKPNYGELLIPPAIVDKGYWTQGLFYTIGNIPLTEEEKNLDYGFYSAMFGEFFKADGTLINKKPKIYGLKGISTRSAIATEVASELIINPSLLEFK